MAAAGKTSPEHDAKIAALLAVSDYRGAQALEDAFFAPVVAWERSEWRDCCVCMEASALASRSAFSRRKRGYARR